MAFIFVEERGKSGASHGVISHPFLPAEERLVNVTIRIQGEEGDAASEMSLYVFRRGNLLLRAR